MPNPFYILIPVIYDDTLTEAFVNVLEKLLNSPPQKKIIIALEKRYVFTLADMDSVAPCYETFLTLLDKAKYRNLKYNWHIQQIPIDFPQYFTYDRVKELILWEISSGNVWFVIKLLLLCWPLQCWPFHHNLPRHAACFDNVKIHES